jgi:hypothetical protein
MPLDGKLRKLLNVERETRLELATPTLARSGADAQVNGIPSNSTSLAMLEKDRIARSRRASRSFASARKLENSNR